jgi:hypothetical protein
MIPPAKGARTIGGKARGASGAGGERLEAAETGVYWER